MSKKTAPVTEEHEGEVEKAPVAESVYESHNDYDPA